MGMRSSPPIRKPSIAPNEPPRVSQSSMTTIHPTPTIEPNASVKYSFARRVRRRAGAETLAASVVIEYDERCSYAVRQILDIRDAAGRSEWQFRSLLRLNDFDSLYAVITSYAGDHIY